MNLRIKSVFLLVAVSAAIFSCSDDDDKKLSNAYVFDGKKKAIKSAVFEDMITDTGGGIGFWFGPVEHEATSGDEWTEYVWIEIPKERLGGKFNLTDEDPYSWYWWVEFWIDEEEIYYSGWGEEGEMNDVKSGTISAIEKGDNRFDVNIDVVFTDGKTLKLNYSGEFVPDSKDGRKSASLQKKHFRNK